MIRSLHTYFRTAFRQKGIAVINISGLAVGLAAVLLILMWVMDELSYERFNENADQIYMVNQDQFYSGDRYRVAVTPHPCAPVWRQQIPEILEITRMVRLPRQLFRIGDKAFYESRVMGADSGLFSIFTCRVLLGDVKETMRNPHSLVLSEKLARKYFGNENPIGKTIELENRTHFTVGAVIKDLPNNTRLPFEAILPYTYLSEIGIANDNWRNNSIYTFVLADAGADIPSLNKKLTDIVHAHNPETNNQFFLFPWQDIHLHAQFGFGEEQKGIARVYLFLAIALFILLIASINFINLTTAKAASRGKEIGIKKASGATRRNMVLQFMAESFLTVMISLVFALVLVALLLGIFNSVTGKYFVVSDMFRLKFIIGFILVGILTAFLAGGYPALYLSSMKPVAILRGEAARGTGNSWLRKILVVIQFSLSIFIALGAIFMYLQLRFMQEKELGYDKENLICISMADKMKDRYDPLKKELLNLPGVKAVTASMENPVNLGSNTGNIWWEGKDPAQEVLIGFNGVTYDYLKTMGQKLENGRDFSMDFPSDMLRDTTGNFLVNEEVVRAMGGGDVIGKKFNISGIQGVIVGVLKNFHFTGVNETISPMVFYLTEPVNLRFMLVRLSPGNLPATLTDVEKTWTRIIPEFPCDYSFTDHDYESLYRTEMRIGALLNYFTIVALIIACLGLYGLSAYEMSKRTREIGIRKVMGAGVFSILLYVSRDFIVLVAISIIIAFGIGWYIIHWMLTQFAYHVDMRVEVFGLIALGALIIALITISFQAIRATEINPAMALRTE